MEQGEVLTKQNAPSTPTLPKSIKFVPVGTYRIYLTKDCTIVQYMFILSDRKYPYIQNHARMLLAANKQKMSLHLHANNEIVMDL